LAGETGRMLVYEKSEDVKNPFNQIAQLPIVPYSTLYEDSNIKKHGSFNPKLMTHMMKSSIVSMTLSSNENNLIFTTESNQILRTEINVDRKCDDSKYDFLIFPFHSGTINGLDVCLKKTLIASCSSDNTVRIWNYSTKQLEICEVYMDEPMSVAFHPSGLHLVVGFVDRVRIMNVYTRSLKQIPDVNINFKGCREIKFSNGGHLFACTNGYSVNVVKFYQGQ
jgi:WD40 repeat protein